MRIEAPQQPAPPASTPYPASKVRLPDEAGGPRWAVLNSAGEYLFTIDDAGNKINPGGTASTPGLSSPGAGVTTGLLVGTGTAIEAETAAAAAARAATTAGARTALTALLASTGQAAAFGAAGGPMGSALTAGITLIVAGGLIYWDYRNRPAIGGSDTETEPEDRIDPGSIPEIVLPKTAPTPGETKPAPLDDGGLSFDPGTMTGAGNPSPPPVTRPTQPRPSDDPDTTHERVLFPSTKPGQHPVPVEGTFWDGNGILRNGSGNPRGQKPGSVAPNPTSPISLTAELFKLKTWQFDDLDDEYKPVIAGIIEVIDEATTVRDTLKDGIALFAGLYGGDINELTGGSKLRDAELRRLLGEGVPEAVISVLRGAAVGWQQAKAPIDKAKEYLGLAGGIAVLKSDGWEVNLRPGEGNKHDLVAYKNGQIMVVEAKGGDPGTAKPGGAGVPESPGSTTKYLAEQMTDPYLWHKLKQDADNDPEFRQWLIDRGMLEAVQAEEPTKVGYRLIRTDTNGQIDAYGSTQVPRNDGVPEDTVIGQTTGNPPGTPETERKPGPNLHGIAQPISPAGDPFTQVGGWMSDLIGNGPQQISGLPHLAAIIAPVPALPAGLWSPGKRTDQSLTVTITATPPVSGLMSKAEELACASYL
ncbi:hypothetical protein ACWDYH_23475 [Nocardia goodfellowii]